MFVRFRLPFGVRKLDRVTVYPAQNAVQAGDRSVVTALAQLHPEHHQASVRIPAAHVLDERNLCFGVLVGMAVGTVRAVCQRLQCTVILLAPAVDVLSAGLVADGGLCDAVLERIFNYHLLKPHVLCYLTHSE